MLFVLFIYLFILHHLPLTMLMYERTAFGSRVVPANSIAKMHARFLPLLMRMYNWYSDDPDPTFILFYIFIRGNRAGTNFPHKVPAREPPVRKAW